NLGKHIWELITVENKHRDGRLNLSNLRLRFTEDSDIGYVCQNCRTIHLHLSGGICKNCFNNLEQKDSLSAKEIQNENFYAKQFAEVGDSIRMRCEELTGQTDNQLERQRLFKGI